MLSLSDTIKALRSLREQAGYGNFQQAVKTLNRERLQNTGREKRRRLPPARYQELFDHQDGKCAWCNELLLIPAKRNDADHINPDRQDLNHWKNWQLLHPKCNKEKSAMTIQEQAKHTGKTFQEIVG